MANRYLIYYKALLENGVEIEGNIECTGKLADFNLDECLGDIGYSLAKKHPNISGAVAIVIKNFMLLN